MMFLGTKTGGRRTKTYLIMLYLLNILPVFLVGLFSSLYGRHMTGDYIANTLHSGTRLIAQQTSDSLVRMETLMVDLWSHPSVTQVSWGSDSHLTKYERNAAINNAAAHLAVLAASSDTAKEINVYYRGSHTKLTEHGNTTRLDDVDEMILALTRTQSRGLIHIDSEWYFFLSPAKGSTLSLDMMVYARLSTGALTDMFDNFVSHPTDESILLFHERTGELVACAAETGVPQISVEEALAQTEATCTVRLENNQQYYLISIPLEWEGLYIARLCLKSAVSMSMTWFTVWIVCLLAISFVTLGIYARLADKLIQEPISFILKAFDRTGVHQPEPAARCFPSIEFNLLYARFTDMVRRLHESIDKEYTQQLLLRNAEYRLLQMQINPHFLYNTYYTLNSLLYGEDYDTAMELSKLLGKFFEYMTESAQTVPLWREVEYATAYAKIQSIRFSHFIRLEMMELPESMRQLEVPKLILQPLIENAFEHGVGDDRGELRVTYQMTPRGFEILVENSGTLSDELLEHIRSVLRGEEATGGGVALANIRKRLIILFKHNTSLEAERSPLGGLGVTIHIGRDSNV